MNQQPKSWNDVSVAQYKEIYSIDRGDYNLMEKYQIQIFSILSDTEPEYFEDVSYPEFTKIQESFSFIQYKPTRPPSQKILTPAGELFLYDDFKKYTIGEWIDLEHFHKDSIEENLGIICTIFYRQLLPNPNPLLFTNKYEPYGDWIYLRESLFDSVPVGIVYGITTKFLEFRETLYADYSGLFDDVPEESDDDIDPNESIIEKAKRIQEEQKDKLSEKWGWDLLLYRLAKMENKSIQEVTGMPLIQALNMLSMKKEMKLPD